MHNPNSSKKQKERQRRQRRHSTQGGDSKYRHGFNSEHKEPMELDICPSSSYNLHSLLSDNLKRFCEAVVHPFGNSAIGATLPDRYQELVIPLTDRLEFDLAPRFFNYPNSPSGKSWTDGGSEAQLVGAFIWFQPRCLASGSTTYEEWEDGQWSGAPTVSGFNSSPFVSVSTNGGAPDVDAPPAVLQQYCLCFTGLFSLVDTEGAPISYGLYYGGSGTVEKPVVAPCYITVPYSRFSLISSTCDKSRILGAGIKCWSEAAPINTGGYSVGGWATIEDIMAAVSRKMSPLDPSPQDYQVNNPGALANFQTSIKFACRTPGIKGSTVRYSPLQTAEQSESEYPIIPPRFYRQVPGYIPNASTQSAIPDYSGVVIQPRNGTDLSVHDVATPGSYVPCIFWSFNTGPAESGGVTQDGVYTLKVMSMVHSEGTPSGNSPFMSTKSTHDPCTDMVKLMLENPETFPAAVSGHSFKSFMAKARKVMGHLGKGLGTATKVIDLISKAYV